MSDQFDPLRVEHTAMRQNAREQRKEFRRSTDAKFSRVMMDVMDDYHKARKAGVSQEDACKGIEAVLREAWPRKVSKFAPGCEECIDTGWSPRSCCDAMRCGRKFCAEAHPSHEHNYVTPCGCVAGDKFRKRVGATEDEITRVGRTQKRQNKGFTRFSQ